MNTVTSFRSSDVQADQLNAIAADYLALEHARVVRRLLTIRCGVIAIALAVAGLGLGWLSRRASGLGVTTLLAFPVWAWLLERARARRLTKRLEQIPGADGCGGPSPSAVRKP